MQKELIESTKKVATRLADVIVSTDTNTQLLADLVAAYDLTVKRILILGKLITKAEEEQVQ